MKPIIKTFFVTLPLIVVFFHCNTDKEKWYHVNVDEKSIENSRIQYRYAGGEFGMAIQDFINKSTNEDLSYSFDAIGTGYAKYDTTEVEFTQIIPENNSVQIEIKTGKTRKFERIFKDLSVLEIEYLEMNALWIEDKIQVAGDSSDITFVMYGMKDIVGMTEGKRLWDEAEKACGHNFGDCFIKANGSTPEKCDYNGYFVYGVINRKTGHGVGFVYPTSITIHDWKVWWDGINQIAIEFFPRGNMGKRWIFTIMEGKDEILKIGKSIVNQGGIKK